LNARKNNKESPTKGLGRKTVTFHLLTMDEEDEPPMKKNCLRETDFGFARETRRCNERERERERERSVSFFV